MTGSAWVISYVILFAAVIVSLALNVNLARLVSRIGIGTENQSHERSIEPSAPGHGLDEGSPFPLISFTGLDSKPIGPADHGLWLLVQVVVRTEEDVNAMSMIPELVPPTLMHNTVILAIGRQPLFSEVQRVVMPAVLVDDRDLNGEAVLRTKYRPHATVVHNGVVIAARPFKSPEDLAMFIDRTLDTVDAEDA